MNILNICYKYHSTSRLDLFGEGVSHSPNEVWLCSISSTVTMVWSPESSKSEDPPKGKRRAFGLFLLSVSVAVVGTAVHSWYIQTQEDCDKPINYGLYASTRTVYKDVKGSDMGKEHKQPGNYRSLVAQNVQIM